MDQRVEVVAKLLPTLRGRISDRDAARRIVAAIDELQSGGAAVHSGYSAAGLDTVLSQLHQ